MGVQNDIKVAKPTHIHFLPLYYYCNNVVNYGELVTRSIHGGGLDKLHCLVITVTLTDRSLKEYTCYVPGMINVLATYAFIVLL